MPFLSRNAATSWTVLFPIFVGFLEEKTQKYVIAVHFEEVVDSIQWRIQDLLWGANPGGEGYYYGVMFAI